MARHQHGVIHLQLQRKRTTERGYKNKHQQSHQFGIEEITATYARNAEKQIAIETKTNAIGMNIYDDIPMEEMPKAKVKATTKIKEEVEA